MPVNTPARLITAMQYHPLPRSWQETPPPETAELTSHVSSGRSGKKSGLHFGRQVFAGAPLVPGPVIIGELGETQAVEVK